MLGYGTTIPKSLELCQLYFTYLGLSKNLGISMLFSNILYCPGGQDFFLLEYFQQICLRDYVEHPKSLEHSVQRL